MPLTKKDLQYGRGTSLHQVLLKKRITKIQTVEQNIKEIIAFLLLENGDLEKVFPSEIKDLKKGDLVTLEEIAYNPKNDVYEVTEVYGNSVDLRLVSTVTVKNYKGGFKKLPDMRGAEIKS